MPWHGNVASVAYPEWLAQALQYFVARVVFIAASRFCIQAA